MGGYYWYFEFHVNDPKTGYEADDFSIASAQEDFFPIDAVLCWKDEVFGSDTKLQITTVFKISEAAYNDLLPRIERDEDEGLPKI